MSSIPLSRDPGDLFVQLYDRLGNQPFATGAAEDWDLDADIGDRATRIEQELWTTGSVPPAILHRALEDGDRGIFSVLRGIDRAFAHFNPFAGRSDPGRLYRIATRYARSARLSTADGVSGALLFSCAFAGRPLGIPEKRQYFELLRVPQESWALVEHDWLQPSSDVTIERVNAPQDHQIRVGCAPMVAAYEEMVIKGVDRRGRRAYRAGPSSRALRDRVARVLDNLDAKHVVVGIVPEATLSDELLEEWRTALKRTANVSTALRWILVGTGPIGGANPPFNRALLLDRRSGRVLLRHDKLNDFTLTAGQVERWRLEPYLGPGEAMEDITKGSLVQLRESNVGRIAMVICEDLARTLDVTRTLRDCGVSHVLAPIFSAPFVGDHGWVEGPAKDHVLNMGAWVVVANSLAVSYAMDVRDPVTCCAIGPPSDGRADYRLATQLERSTGPEDVAVVVIGPGMARRYDDFVS